MEIRANIVMTGIICLTAIYMCMLVCGDNSQWLKISIVTAIALAIGVVIPAPKIDDKTGVLRW